MIKCICSFPQRGNNAPRARDGRVRRGRALYPAVDLQLDRVRRAILAADVAAPAAQVGVHRGASLCGAAGQEAAQGTPGTNLP